MVTHASTILHSKHGNILNGSETGRKQLIKIINEIKEVVAVCGGGIVCCNLLLFKIGILFYFALFVFTLFLYLLSFSSFFLK